MTSKTMFQSDCCRTNTFTVRNGNDTYHLECDKCKKPCVGFAPTVDRLNLLQLKRCKCNALTPDECQCGAWKGSINYKGETMEERIHITNGEDKDIVAAILLNNGYKVWYETIGEIEILCYENMEKGE